MSVTAPLGFRAAGVVAGLKQSGERDVAVVINDGPSRAAAAVFTANRVQAAPVKWTRQVVSGGRVRAVVLNSGGANACTGPQGFQDTHATAERLAAAMTDSAGEIAVCSTGLIGERLPMDKLLGGVNAAIAEESRPGRHDAEVAISNAQSSSPTGKTTSASQQQIASQYAGPGTTAPETSANWREVWHSYRELLPAGVPYQQVDFDFITRKGYGKNVMQRNADVLNTLEAARKPKKG